MNYNKTIFLYWVGRDYNLIKIFRDYMHTHSDNEKKYNIVLINNNNINNYIKNLPHYFSKLCPAHQADFVRVNVICDYGGIWLDSDTLVMNDLSSLFDLIKNKDGFFIKENNEALSNGVFGSKKQTPLMIEWKKQMIHILNEKKEGVGWTEIGSDILQNIYNVDKDIYNNYKIFDGLNNMYPVNWDGCVTEFIDKPYDNYKNIIRDFQPIIVLVNSVYKRLDYMDEEEILNSKMPLNYFINKSYNKSI